MGAFFDSLPDHLIEWIQQQKLFFVASAPLDSNGHVNVSPKGHSTFHLVSQTSAWYLDLTGSGNETISHMQENGRITIMFCAFEGPPRICRLYGTGRILERGTADFESLVSQLPAEESTFPGQRSIVWIDIHKVGTSCGYSVPFYDFKEERKLLLNSMQRREKLDEAAGPDGQDKDGLAAYWVKKNSESIDGLPGYMVMSKNRRLFGTKAAKKANSDLAKGLFLGVVAGILGVYMYQRASEIALV